MNYSNIYPQHLLETPLLIKTELDRLQLGYKELENYVKEKIFYPKPQVYTNITTVELWNSLNSRHGSSTTRNSNFVPVVRNELSEGLYKFQRVIVTGSAPMPYSLHEEPQTQFYYSMKASYFHMSFMYDLNHMITNGYRWQFEDLSRHDDRQNEKFHLGVGFDYKNFAVEYSIVDINYGIRHNELFHSDTLSLHRYGFFYTHRLIKASLYIGSSFIDEHEDEELLVPSDDAEDWEIEYINHYNDEILSQQDASIDYNFYRLNLDFSTFNNFKVCYSLIYKHLTFKKEHTADGLKGFLYESKNLTNVLYLNYNFKEEDLFLRSFISMEMLKNRSGSDSYTNEYNYNYYKGGISVGLVF